MSSSPLYRFYWCFQLKLSDSFIFITLEWKTFFLLLQWEFFSFFKAWMIKLNNILQKLFHVCMCVCVCLFGVCVCQDRTEGRVEQWNIQPQLPITGSQHVKHTSDKVREQRTCTQTCRHINTKLVLDDQSDFFFNDFTLTYRWGQGMIIKLFNLTCWTSSNCCISSMFPMFQSHFNDELNTLLVFGGSSWF